MNRARFAIAFVLFGVAALLAAQDAATQKAPSIPTITYERLWEAATPQSFTITVDSTGKANYVSRNPTRLEEGTQQPEEPYAVDFTMSDAGRDRLFQAAKALHYFQGDFDFKQHRVADTGRKTLSYSDALRHFQTVYNWSDNKDLEQITQLFQGISNTFEHGRKLQFLRRFDKLGLDQELRAMENDQQRQYLAELQVIAPVLKNIVNDPGVMNMARQRAQGLLARAGVSGD